MPDRIVWIDLKRKEDRYKEYEHAQYYYRQGRAGFQIIPAAVSAGTHYQQVRLVTERSHKRGRSGQRDAHHQRIR